MARNRVIYQSQALFMSPTSTGYHMQTGNRFGSIDAPYNTSWTGVTGITLDDGDEPVNGGAAVVLNRTLIEPLHRVQSANFNFTINRQDINEFGKLARLDSIVMESPTVGLTVTVLATIVSILKNLYSSPSLKLAKGSVIVTSLPLASTFIIFVRDE